MSNYKEISTSKDIYFSILKEHREELGVFESCTDLIGQFGSPCIITVWGFKGEQFPIVGAETTFDCVRPNGERVNEKHRYFLCVGVVEDEQ